MHFTQFQLALVVCASTLVQSLPTSLVAASDLLTNGQAAQALNAQFQTLTASSPYLTTACIDNSIATCKDDAWTTSNACAKSQSCFAIPNVKNGGTTLTCTSEKNALSVINATGATGGITGTGSTGSSTSGTKSKPATANSASITSPTPPATATRPDSQNRVTVTVTLTKPVDISATRTISPQEASSIISSLLKDGQATTISQDSEVESTPCPKMKHSKTKSATTAPIPTPTETTDNLVTTTPGATMTLVAVTETGEPLPSATPAPTVATTATSGSSGDGYGY